MNVRLKAISNHIYGLTCADGDILVILQESTSAISESIVQQHQACREEFKSH